MDPVRHPGKMEALTYQDPLPKERPNAGGHKRKYPDQNQELFDVQADPHETKDLSKEHPAVVTELQAKMDAWWNPNGKFKPLHMLNPCRLDYIVEQIASEFDRDPADSSPFQGLRILDIGCGGGLLCEPMARLGATVIGADAAETNIKVASIHAKQMSLAIDYRHTTAEALASAGEKFDAILNMEVIEHVADPRAFLAGCFDLLKPGGLMVCSTINRNPKS